jgi:hypothetical protein
MLRSAILFLSHSFTLAVGFALGIYILPIITAPNAPDDQAITVAQTDTMFTAEFVKDLPGSDFLHWGAGQVNISSTQISLLGELAPGPDYILYLSPTYVDDRASFNANRRNMVAVGDVKTFDNFIVPVSSDINVADFNTVIVWCESFGAFITSAQYQP